MLANVTGGLSGPATRRRRCRNWCATAGAEVVQHECQVGGVAAVIAARLPVGYAAAAAKLHHAGAVAGLGQGGQAAADVMGAQPAFESMQQQHHRTARRPVPGQVDEVVVHGRLLGRELVHQGRRSWLGY